MNYIGNFANIFFFYLIVIIIIIKIYYIHKENYIYTYNLNSIRSTLNKIKS